MQKRIPLSLNIFLRTLQEVLLGTNSLQFFRYSSHLPQNCLPLSSGIGKNSSLPLAVSILIEINKKGHKLTHIISQELKFHKNEISGFIHQGIELLQTFPMILSFWNRHHHSFVGPVQFAVRLTESYWMWLSVVSELLPDGSVENWKVRKSLRVKCLAYDIDEDKLKQHSWSNWLRPFFPDNKMNMHACLCQCAQASMCVDLLWSTFRKWRTKMTALQWSRQWRIQSVKS